MHVTQKAEGVFFMAVRLYYIWLH